MKCRGCKWSGTFSDENLTGAQYCIGAPNHDTPKEWEHIIRRDRLYQVEGDAVGPTYLVEDNDECVLWFSERFEPANHKAKETA